MIAANKTPADASTPHASSQPARRLTLQLGRTVLIYAAAALSSCSDRQSPQPDPPVEFPGFNPVSRNLRQVVIGFSSIADNLELLQHGQIDSPTAARRIREIKGQMQEDLAQWRTHPAKERAQARSRLAAEMLPIGQRFSHAKKRIEGAANPDASVLQALDRPPRWSDVLGAPLP